MVWLRGDDNLSTPLCFSRCVRIFNRVKSKMLPFWEYKLGDFSLTRMYYLILSILLSNYSLRESQFVGSGNFS